MVAMILDEGSLVSFIRQTDSMVGDDLATQGTEASMARFYHTINGLG